MTAKEEITAKRCDREEIIRAATAMTAIGRGGVTELRALNAVVNGDRWPATYAGYFNDAEALATAAATITSADALYVIPNEVKPEELARAANRLRRCGKGESTSDNAIAKRSFLLIDCDANRLAGISATDKEHEAAIERARMIRAEIFEWQWPDGILADSGNGAHLIYPIDGVPVDDEGLIEHCLDALQAEFGDAVVKIDTSVHNPARIWKLPGTLACKGDSTADRPHRMARIIDLPEDFGTVHVTHEQLEALAAKAPSKIPAKVTAPVNGHHVGNGHVVGGFDLERFMAQYLPAAEGPAPYQGGQRWILPECPFNAEHNRGEAFVIKRADGPIQAGCRHESCKWKWHDLREKFDPKQQPTRHEQQSKQQSGSHSGQTHQEPFRFERQVSQGGTLER
jgi:hypothetical protein